MPTDERPDRRRPADERLAVELIARTDYGRVATSMRAMPFLAFARHIVVDGRVLLRMPLNCGYHLACAGSVVAYGTDNLSCARRGEGLWSVQIVGRCEPVEPTAAELELFGPAPPLVDGAPYEPVYLCIEPQFASVNSTDGDAGGHLSPVL
ncbi:MULTISPECIES: pyridoxamine 5'-phosphate oxidase family protein [unclassified Streptomyces]|uniref:pyridoxamine 5'-phosphate oxidase family protein n=1 Tax=unclassified Streptomyces TaxID=2593676 RepID=UPI0013B86CE1|nr:MULTISPECIES: pyridoxamine 5'-phosphate oxidase family protein [unclassified Streptomyces]NEB31907.1 pyridoxamine 5'-phosphate oxidase family protein [Streptomyces sp. SID14446]WSD78628.1 pyridoxamine 5'-phosphate oxidase family protein [Streptomyces sp. NBC_01558]